MNENPQVPVSGKWKRYPSYKQSGVKWLGEVPEGWRILRVKTLEKNQAYTVQTGPFGAQLHSSDYIDDGVPLILIRNVNNLKIDDSEIPKISIEDAQRLSQYQLEIGDIVFSRVGSIGRIALCTERERGWLISGQMLRLRIKNQVLDKKFSVYVFSSTEVARYIELQSVGSTRESINTEILSNLHLQIPTLFEQTSITTFLDRETARIDALIEKKERLIALLEEKRAALISHAVTKGLDPDAKMKDSGIEWIGMVPEDWNGIHLRRTFKKVDYGISGNLEIEGKYGILTMGNIQEGEIILNKLGFTDSIPADLLLAYGDLVFNRTNSLALVGKVGIFRKTPEDNISLASYLVRIRLKEHHDPEFFNYLLNCEGLLGIARSLALPSIGQANLNPNRYGYIRVLIPPFEEQKAISKFLTLENKQTERLIERIRCSINTLQEYRSTIISAAVTGKIDVRQEVIA